MQTLRAIEAVRQWRETVRQNGQSVAFVPTMGYLHEGHLQLVKAARAKADRVAVSIFVNPLQFGPQEDFDRYPRDERRDERLLIDAGVDMLFLPSAEEMYPHGLTAQQTTIQNNELSGRLCGASRPGHFTGVLTVVAKLFHIIQPDMAFFGEKDMQQLIIVRRMVDDLNWPVQVIGVPTVREPDGLAKSSRNVYLSGEERLAATILYRALQFFEREVQAGERDARRLREKIVRFITEEPLARIDYVEIVDAVRLQPMDRLHGTFILALAVYIGTTRLIDNKMMTLT